MMEFGGKIVFFGCGSVAQCSLAMLHAFIKIQPKHITIIDFVDNRDKVAELIAKGAHYIQEKVTPDNYIRILETYLSAGDFLIDLAWNIETINLVDWCHHHDVLYMNTSVEVWDPYTGARDKKPAELTLYHRQMQIRAMTQKRKKLQGPTAIVDHGANPGLVSHFTKLGLQHIAKEILKKNLDSNRKCEIEKALEKKDFAQLAYLMGLKTIHISERDSQITDQPKRVNEFVNTWSVEGLIEEGVAPAELGWGTHETLVPKNAFFHSEGPCNQIGLLQKGAKTWVQSWVPSGPITGLVIRHGEAFSISDQLTVWNGDQAKYRPTVHYAYCPSDSAVNSLHELEMRHYVPQPKHRIMTDEIIAGKDELGCLLMGHDLGAWWIGSCLDIETARKLVPGQNATTVQVAAGVLACAVYAIRHPQLGLCLPDALNHEEILEMAMPFLGDFLSIPVTWSPLDHAREYADYGIETLFSSDPYQFANFVVSPMGFQPASCLTNCNT